MCTVSWLYQPGGYQLFCNRDEKHHRLPAAAPRVSVRRGIHYIAPVDGNAGGTWLAVNEAGLSLCLLNGNTPAPAQARSRGLLLLDWIDAVSLHDLERRWQDHDLSRYAGFTLFAIGEKCVAFHWDGYTRSAQRDAVSPLLSSSYDPEGVQQKRAALFPAVATGVSLLAFHRSHGSSGASAYTPCMHRPDAATVSFSHVLVSPREIDFRYIGGAPCETRVASRSWLARKAVAA